MNYFEPYIELQIIGYSLFTVYFPKSVTTKFCNVQLLPGSNQIAPA